MEQLIVLYRRETSSLLWMDGWNSGYYKTLRAILRLTGGWTAPIEENHKASEILTLILLTIFLGETRQGILP
jgi:hypothetical protein